ncbi:HIT family protein [endosymbiont GvMRE of Glomus versiforme]|uniref:HIT family protein n=1 Tax=endosymbiont GvMRE of Glomus versiforme TaxID=2039283 RepID=UPI000EC42500|nr:HIT family protein [endosymbiont GvMRE of Glomus versiforme]RHZ36828.1 Histidine triad (HIT) protein [endosymbiont GvMRE of Glomus versiforme]
MPNCLFCQIIEGKVLVYIVAKDEKNKCLAFLDINPASEGHTLIITKTNKHAKNITELEQTSWNNILPLLKKVVKKLQKTFPNIQGFNFISNMGENAYQSVFHFHLHIIPKYKENEGFIWTVKKKTIDLVSQAANKLKIELTEVF